MDGGGCTSKLISPPKSLEHFFDWGVMEQLAKQVYHTSKSSRDNQSMVD